MNKVVISSDFDPYLNLALEEYLFDTYCGGVILYLWRNDRTIVIGRNQNAYRECKIAEFENANGKVARRTTGGGAVYQDKGNLCFTFIASNELYDEKKQLDIILKAMENFGIYGEKSGRNDLVVQGKKFSGNAFRHSGAKSIHHGTLLLDADLSALSKYLTVSAEKIKSKGIKSVISRVINLASLNPELTADKIYSSIMQNFKKVYGNYTTVYSNEITATEYLEKAERFASWQWRLGENPSFGIIWEKRFSIGLFSFNFDVKNGLIQNSAVFSDALDAELPSKIAAALKVVQFDLQSMKNAVEKLNIESTFKEELFRFFKEKIV